MKFKLLLRVTRAPFFTATLIPISFGAAFAHYQTGYFNLWRFILTLLGALFIHAGLNMANDYFDFLNGNDNFTKSTPVSGGSKVIQEGLVKPKKIFWVSILFFLSASIIGLYLNFTSKGNFILFLGIIGVIIAYFYSAPPLKIGYRGGMGEIICAIGFGPIMILGAYYVQIQQFSFSTLFASLPIGILIGLILFLNEFPDYEADRKVNKNTLVVLFGTQKASFILIILLLFCYLITLILITTAIFPLATIVVFATIPLAFFISRRVFLYHNNIEKLLLANISMIKLQIIFGIILIITLVL